MLLTRNFAFFIAILQFLASCSFSQVNNDGAAINQTDGKDRKQGLWVDTTDNVRSTGFYVNDKKHGSWTTYHNSGIIQFVESYNNGKKEGVFLELDSRGTLVSEQFF
jgi:hypothetical protein